MIIPGARFKKLQRLIAKIVSSTHLPRGRTAEINRIEDFLKCGNAAKEAVDLIEFVLPHVDTQVYLSFLNQGIHTTNVKCLIRNLSIEMLGKHHVSLSIWWGRYRGVVRKVRGAITYKLDVFRSLIEIDSRQVLAAKNDMIVFKGGYSFVIHEEAEEQW